MKNIKNIRYQVNLLTNEVENKNLYKTTSFTLLKSVHKTFLDVCKKEKRIPSDVIRELINLYIDDQGE